MQQFILITPFYNAELTNVHKSFKHVDAEQTDDCK
jgi:hypothetical protein